MNLLKEIYGIPGGSEHTAVVIELPPGIGIVWREFLILFHQLCPELLLCLRFLWFMVGVVLVVVRKGHKAPFEVVHQDVTEPIPLGEAVLSPDARLFLRQRLNQLLLPVEPDGRRWSWMAATVMAIMCSSLTLL